MVRAFGASLLVLTLPLATPAFAQVCHPAHHHKVAALHKVAHHDSGLGVTIDQVRLISFPKPVKTVYVGNPVIADITMLDPQHAFLLGKTFGLTNMIALDSEGKQVSNQQVVVYNNVAAVTVNRGPDQYDYMCTNGHCETAPRPGDPPTFVTTTESTAQSHEAGATGAGNSSPAGPTTAQNQTPGQ
jgi:hypothetical protein